MSFGPTTTPAARPTALINRSTSCAGSSIPGTRTILSVDYVAVQGELVWLDPTLVMAESATFLVAAQAAQRGEPSLETVVDLLVSYRGAFAPEFEYEEWAMAWRSRVHTTFLDLASRRSIELSLRETWLPLATWQCMPGYRKRQHGLRRRLVWLYWHLGAVQLRPLSISTYRPANRPMARPSDLGGDRLCTKTHLTNTPLCVLVGRQRPSYGSRRHQYPHRWHPGHWHNRGEGHDGAKPRHQDLVMFDDGSRQRVWPCLFPPRRRGVGGWRRGQAVLEQRAPSSTNRSVWRHFRCLHTRFCGTNGT